MVRMSDLISQPKIQQIFLRERALAQALGISHDHFTRKIKALLTEYPGGGKVVLYEVAAAVALIKSGALRPDDKP
jgi:hypothetical protein